MPPYTSPILTLLLDSFLGGRSLALDKESGKEVWSVPMTHYTWSSPVDIYTPQGKGYIVQCDSAGNMFLIDGASGKMLDAIRLEGAIESSPVVYDDIIVVGTRGQKIYGIRIN